MVRLKLDSDTLGLSNIMERMTHARVKDCFKDENYVYFIVSQGDLGRALGKGAVNVKRLQEKVGKKVKIIEYQDEPVKYLRNIIYPVKVEEIIQEDSSIIVRDRNKKTKSLLIGRDGKNLQAVKRAFNRFYDLELKVE